MIMDLIAIWAENKETTDVWISDKCSPLCSLSIHATTGQGIEGYFWNVLGRAYEAGSCSYQSCQPSLTRHTTATGLIFTSLNGVFDQDSAIESRVQTLSLADPKYLSVAHRSHDIVALLQVSLEAAMSQV